MADFNDRRSSARESTILSSIWTGLSPHLIAKFYPVKKMADGSWEQSRDKYKIASADKYEVDDGYEVHAPITDGNSEMTLNWNSPFENAGAESKAPALSAMLQSGSLAPILQAMGSSGFMSGKFDEMAKKSADFTRSLAGRTGITKLNSTQIFTGMPPVKMSLTLHFRALQDPVMEVKNPLIQLKEWALPQRLAIDGLIANGINNGIKQNPIETIFPSKAPQIIGMQYGDMTYEPMVIESISDPVTAPRSSDGVIIACSVQITLGTLTALDRGDMRKIYR